MNDIGTWTHPEKVKNLYEKIPKLKYVHSLHTDSKYRKIEKKTSKFLNSLQSGQGWKKDKQVTFFMPYWRNRLIKKEEDVLTQPPIAASKSAISWHNEKNVNVIWSNFRLLSNDCDPVSGSKTGNPRVCFVFLHFNS